VARICLSLNVPGSDSSALQITLLTLPAPVSRTSSHFCPVGNPRRPCLAGPESFKVAIDVVGSERAGEHGPQRGVSLGRHRPRPVRVVRPWLSPRLCDGLAPGVSGGRPRRSTSASLTRPGRSFTATAGAMVTPAEAGHLRPARRRGPPVALAHLGDAHLAVAQEAPARSCRGLEATFLGGSVRK